MISAALLLGACGDDDSVSGVSAAQTRVSSKEKAVTEAKAAYDAASAEFCADSKTYIATIDRYGKAFNQSAATVGDVKAAGADLAKPQAAVESSANDVVDKREAVAAAEKELVDAKAALATAQANESGAATSAPPPDTTTTTTPLLPPGTVDRVKQAEADLTAASQGISDQTPLIQATAEFNSAAYALEVAWLRVFADAGCLTDEQQKQAEAAVREYTAALQAALAGVGYYKGEVDGVYGPTTVEAVKQLQTAAGLPATGLVDRATATALSTAMVSKGGSVANQAQAHTAAVQSTLKLAGYWSGPVNGQWTQELTDALKTFQTALGVPASGVADTATLSALNQKIATGQAAATTPTTVAPTTPTTLAG